MSEKTVITEEEIEAAYQKMKKDAESGGYQLNKDVEFVKGVIKGILVNIKRYGYGACPCRLASGKKEEDLDIVCPCDYRDEDISEFGACYCGLYVSKEVNDGARELKSIPERRPRPELRRKKSPGQPVNTANLPYPVWRCTVCGYLCARKDPPEICPVCKVKKDRFERFI